MKQVLLSLAVAFMSVGSFAQSDPVPVDDPCLLATDEATWTSLDLNADQLKEVMDLQTNCKTACAAVSETGERDARTGAAMLEQHEERIRKVLSADQYVKWKAWCAERTSRGQLH